jgi:hypothetical protein
MRPIYTFVRITGIARSTASHIVFTYSTTGYGSCRHYLFDVTAMRSSSTRWFVNRNKRSNWSFGWKWWLLETDSHRTFCAMHLNCVNARCHYQRHAATCMVLLSTLISLENGIHNLPLILPELSFFTPVKRKLSRAIIKGIIERCARSELLNKKVSQRT